MSETAQPSAVVEGQTDATVTVSRVIDQGVEQVWKAFNTAAGVESLLGAGATLGGKGEPWRSADGTNGVLRSYHAPEQIRVSWHADEDAPPTIIDIHLVPQGEQTELRLEHQHLAPDDCADLQNRWNSALERFAATVE